MNPITVGILGGGQLGAMLQEAGEPMGITFAVLDAADCPLSKKAKTHLVGSTDDPQKTRELAEHCDRMTIEIEKVSVPALREVAQKGFPVYPPPEVIEVIQDKGRQKEFFQSHSIPTAPYVYAGAQSPMPEKFPCVQKLRRGGYDGRGVKMLQDAEDWKERLEGDSILEEKVDIAKEISVIVVRNPEGETRTFPAVEMVFDPRYNQLDHLLCPARISPQEAEQARKLAVKIAEQLQTVGLLAVEMFLTAEGKILVNELAPRPHNSGHHTIEACESSQFEQHLRAVCGMKLGSTELRSPFALLYNLVGEPGHTGPMQAQGLAEAESLPGVYVHLYGKVETRPGRKMGHVTILAQTLEEGETQLQKVRKCLKIISQKK